MQSTSEGIEALGSSRSDDMSEDVCEATAKGPAPKKRERIASWSSGFGKMIGLTTIYDSPIDAKILLAQRFVRVFAFGLTALLLAAYLTALGNSETQVGIFFACTLIGDMIVGFVLSQIADTFGRRNVLILGGAGMACSGAAFAVSDQYWVLMVAAILGVVSPSATEVGPFKSIEESALYDLVPDGLVDVFSWYTFAEFFSGGIGIATSGAIVGSLQSSLGWDYVSACRVIFGIYAAIGMLKVAMSLCLSVRTETADHQRRHAKRPNARPPGRDRQLTRAELMDDEDEEHDAFLPTVADDTFSNDRYVTPSFMALLRERMAAFRQDSLLALSYRDKRLLLEVILLICIDSTAVGMSSVPWQTYYVRTRFNVAEGPLGTIFLFALILGALGTLTSAPVTRLLGSNIISIAVTYIPGGILMGLYPLATSLTTMILLLCVQSFFELIYVAPRNAFFRHVLNKEKRTASMGLMNMFKILTNGTGSFLTGFWADREMFWFAFVLSAGLKIVYCLSMLYAFLELDLAAEQEVRRQARLREDAEE